MTRLLLLAMAFVSAALAGWLAMKKPQGPQTSTPAQEPGFQEVLVAARDIDFGMPLGTDSFKWQRWPEVALNSKLILRSKSPNAESELLGAIVRVRLVANEPIEREILAPRGSGFLSAMLSPGKRAVAVRVTAENTAGGFIFPNDHVDVLQTVTETGSEGERKSAARPILRNIRVLAIGQLMETDTEKTKGKSAATSQAAATTQAAARTATLELTPEQAEVIVAAETAGRLSLVLRSAMDNREAAAEEVKNRTIRIMRGGQAETIRIEGQGASARVPQAE